MNNTTVNTENGKLKAVLNKIKARLENVKASLENVKNRVIIRYLAYRRLIQVTLLLLATVSFGGVIYLNSIEQSQQANYTRYVEQMIAANVKDINKINSLEFAIPQHLFYEIQNISSAICTEIKSCKTVSGIMTLHANKIEGMSKMTYQEYFSKKATTYQRLTSIK